MAMIAVYTAINANNNVNNNNNDNNNSNNNNNKNTNENKKRKKRRRRSVSSTSAKGYRNSLASAAINEDINVVKKLIEQPLSDEEITNDIMNLFLDDFLKGSK